MAGKMDDGNSPFGIRIELWLQCVFFDARCLIA